LVVEPVTAKGISIAVREERAFLTRVQEKAAFLLSAHERVAFRMTVREKAVSIAQGKEAPARSGLPLTESRVQDPGDSVTETSLFSVTGRVPVRNSHYFQKGNGFLGSFFPQLH
jgi:hypothetical protein